MENQDASYYVAVIQNMEKNPISITTGSGAGSKPFRTLPTAGDFIAVRPLDFQYYGLHRVIFYHVLSDYAALYVPSSNTSQNLTNPSSGIINGYDNLLANPISPVLQTAFPLNPPQ